MWPILSKISTHITVVWEVWAGISHNYLYSFHPMWPILSKMSTHITIVWEVLARMKISTKKLLSQNIWALISQNTHFTNTYEHSYHTKTHFTNIYEYSYHRFLISRWKCVLISQNTNMYISIWAIVSEMSAHITWKNYIFDKSFHAHIT